MPAAPDIARIGALMGDRARAAMLSHLTAGRAFTAGELARAARVTKQTTSFHLRRLVGGGLVAVERRGRHRYFRLTGPDVGAMLEAVMGVATRVGALRVQRIQGCGGPGSATITWPVRLPCGFSMPCSVAGWCGPTTGGSP